MTNDTRREFSRDMGSYGARPPYAERRRKGKPERAVTKDGFRYVWDFRCGRARCRFTGTSLFNGRTRVFLPKRPCPLYAGKKRDRRERGTVGAVRSPLRFPARFELDGVRACRRLLRTSFNRRTQVFLRNVTPARRGALAIRFSGTGFPRQRSRSFNVTISYGSTVSDSAFPSGVSSA